jgi:Holliday junction resolvase
MSNNNNLNLKILLEDFFMYRYGKGARGERELVKIFSERGYSVIRSAGSGLNDSPDLVVIKNGKGYSFECKNWKERRIKIPKIKYMELKRWKENTKFDTYIAWKISHKGWVFIPIDKLKENEKTYSISIEDAEKEGLKMQDII